jgi:hypothetical protein
VDNFVENPLWQAKTLDSMRVPIKCQIKQHKIILLKSIAYKYQKNHKNNFCRTFLLLRTIAFL